MEYARKRITVNAKKIQIRDNLTNFDRAILFAGEFFGTATLVFLGCLGCVSGVYGPDKPIPHLQISFTFGLAIMVGVQCVGHISGGHINPAVTIASVVLGHTPLIHFPIYFVAQMLGGIAGFGALKIATPEVLFGNSSLPKYCSPGYSAYINAGQACFVEFLLTFILLMICAAVWDCRNTDKHDSVSIRLGLTVAVLAMAGGPYSGANMNPARSFGPALFNGDWGNHWIYWIGPMAGGLFAGIVYRFLFSKEPIIEQNNTLEGTPLNDKS